MNYSTIDLKIENHIAEVALNQPKKANAMDQIAWRELEEVFNALEENDDVHVVLLSGEGKHFCAGIDLNLLGSAQEGPEDICPASSNESLRKLILSLQAPINKIESCSKPVIAVVHGGCIGAGLDIIAACDMRYCTTESFFTIKEIDMAMVADLGSLQRLPRIMPEGIVREMAYTGKNLKPEEALQAGLVNYIYENKVKMLEGVKQTAHIIAQKSSLAIRGSKAVLNHAREHSILQGLEYVATWNAAMMRSMDMKEALQAYHEKRPPSYQKGKL